MKTTPLNPQELETIASNPGLSRYVRQLEEGRPATPHSWLYESQDSQETLNAWLEVLSSVRDLKGIGETVYQFDLKQVEKFGPQGKVPPVEEGLETLADSYATEKFEDNANVGVPEKAFYDFAKELFGSRVKRERPLRFESVIDDMRERDTLETNSGWPLFSRRRKPDIVAASIADATSEKCYEYPAILLFRSYNGKLRPVWMYPMSMNLVEFSFTMKIQDVLRRRNLAYITPWDGFEAVEQQFTKDWIERPYAISGDTTKMDAHFRWTQMSIVFNIVKYLFQEQYWDSLQRCMKHVNEIEVVVGPNAKLTGSHGIASGSGWTQLSETIFQMWMCWNCSHSTTAVQTAAPLLAFPDLKYGMGIGDDFIWFIPKEQADLVADMPDVAKAMTAMYLENGFGLPANPSKQEVGSEEGYFLQRLFLTQWSNFDSPVFDYLQAADPNANFYYLGIYPTIRALNSMLNPEKFYDPEKWSSDMFCTRIFMILENTVGHPLFKEFCAFVAKGQKDIIPFAKKTRPELDAITDEARSLPGLTPTYNQRMREKSLADFVSIQYVSTL